MPRPPRIRPIDESLLREAGYNSAGVLGARATGYPSKPDLPYWTVHALLLGLLTHFDEPEQRRDMKRVSGDVLVKPLLTAVEQEAASETAGLNCGYTDEQVKHLAHTVRDVMQSQLRHPSENTLAAESAWLLPQLAGYGSIQGERRRIKREQWLVEHLPAILRGLLHNHRCPFMDCRPQTTMPKMQDLEEWTEINSVGEVRLHILAHYHGCTYAVVKERFHRPPPRRISGRKPPTTP